MRHTSEVREAANREFSVVLDSYPGAATEGDYEAIGNALDGLDGIQEWSLGIDKQGVVTVVVDLNAPSFTHAVGWAVSLVENALRDAGVAFRVDPKSIPVGTE